VVRRLLAGAEPKPRVAMLMRGACGPLLQR